MPLAGEGIRRDTVNSPQQSILNEQLSRLAPSGRKEDVSIDVHRRSLRSIGYPVTSVNWRLKKTLTLECTAPFARSTRLRGALSD